MILVKKNTEKNIKVETKRIYINTLTPNFQFKNKYGKTIMPMRNCIKL